MEKKKISIFFQVFLGIFLIAFFSNVVLLGLLYSGYERVFSDVRPLLSPETLKSFEVNIFNTWVMILVFLPFIIAIVVLFAVLFSSRLVGPIKKLVEVTKEVGKGNLDVMVKPQRQDEIGELAEEFNSMIKELKEAREILETEKDVLEIKVRARTRELEELAQSLDEKVKLRTKELQERIEELEKFHRLTVGRELKMIELKEKIKKLEEKIRELEKEKNKIPK